MTFTRHAVLISSITLLLTGCVSSVEGPQYQASEQLPPYLQSNFQSYIQDSRQWLLQHRVFLTGDKSTELAAVAPYELIPKQPNGQGILLVHGLGDSPFSYSDIAADLVSQGYRVRVILLPGHGTRAADLSLVQLKDWQEVVQHHYQLLNNKVDGVWLGGYSTGANLVTSLAYEHPSIKGLLLFSPAFKPKNPLAALSPMASYFVNWESKKKEDNYTRYNSLHMNGAATYYKSAQAVQHDLASHHYDKPTFVMLSEADETIDAAFARDTFSQTFTNPNNQLLWFGESRYPDPRIHTFSMNLPQQHIHSASHVSLIFSPDNPVYKRDGKIRMCFNEQPKGQDCATAAADKVWFSAYGDGDEKHIRARMTWNPYFEQNMQQLNAFLKKNRH
ncbi:alpha/beta hydrolase [Vibrio rarus]|uniref:alpha/beta hydrolase n=1 Tax=Vibrio rarus TaxID=413403 RepID=UPI0021C373E0|nr:alpha/beta fold hydrolase [Vibrio rarus]